MNLKEEIKLWKRGYKRVTGLDEVGRGPLAGPVVACAVVVEQFFNFPIQFRGINDSKKLSPKKRKKFYKILTRHPNIKWRIGRVSEKVIDKINIKNAAELAMEKAVLKLKPRPDFLIIDGKYLGNQKLKTINHKLIVKADEKIFSCAVASILAKVTRDRIMQKYHRIYPKYGFDKNKGYGTKFHLEMLKKYGPCKIHRESFEPLKRFD